MNFLLTKYIYPLKEQFLLSENLEICLDNPRTDREIEAVTEYITQAYSAQSSLRFSEEIIEREVKYFLTTYSQADEYVSEFYNKNSYLNQYEILARMWIVARYNDEGEHKAITEANKKLREEGKDGYFLIEGEDSPIIKNSRQTTDYSHLVSLLIHTDRETYFGGSLILDERADWFQEVTPNELLLVQFLRLWNFTRNSNFPQIDEDRWLYFPSARSELARISKLLDDVLGRNSKEKLLYIASLLKNAGSDIKEDKTRLVVLVSVIELLLTHNPDFSRFNVEDSINKQFQLKAATLVYLDDKSKDVQQVKARLKEIYGLRSAIAHGNFKAVTKYVETAKKKGEDYPLEVIITELYSYLRAIILAYLQDEEFVDFLKES